VGGFLGLLIGIGLALFAERMDRRLRTRDEVEEAFGLPVLAEVPKLSRADVADDALVAFTAPMSRVAEAFRAVRTSLAFQQSVSAGGGHSSGNGANGSNGRNGNGTAASADQLFDTGSEPLVVMVTSAAPREGKSTTTANLAVSFAEAGASVLVVNCDFRRPTIHKRFAVSDEPRRVQDSRVPDVKIVTNVLQDPRANPSHVVAAQRHVIAAARGRFDVILLDTAPLLTANDALEVVGAVDLVLLVAQTSLTTRDNAQRVTELLGRVDAAMAGVVLIGTADTSNSEYYYYYQRTPGVQDDGDDRGEAARVQTAELFEGAPDDAIRTEG
jgi:capsular exopolysaccharide synthesis family protein